MAITDQRALDSATFLFDTLAYTMTLTPMPSAHASQVLVDFSRPEVLREFRVINDGVMGGVSTSWLGVRGAAMVFEGVVSLENNGGFASFRGPVRSSAWSAALLLTVRGDGQRYKLTLKLDDNSGTVQYQAAFVAPHEWQTLRFVAADFVASFRGRPISAPTVRFADVRYLGLVISDKQSGAFKVELKDGLMGVTASNVSALLPAVNYSTRGSLEW